MTIFFVFREMAPIDIIFCSSFRFVSFCLWSSQIQHDDFHSITNNNDHTYICRQLLASPLSLEIRGKFSGSWVSMAIRANKTRQTLEHVSFLSYLAQAFAANYICKIPSISARWVRLRYCPWTKQQSKIGRAEIRTRRNWVRSANTTPVLCSPPFNDFVTKNSGIAR